MDAPLPSSSHAPSIWYEDVATPQRNPSGSRRSLDVADSVATACSRPPRRGSRAAGRQASPAQGEGRRASDLNPVSDTAPKVQRLRVRTDAPADTKAPCAYRLEHGATAPHRSAGRDLPRWVEREPRLRHLRRRLRAAHVLAAPVARGQAVRLDLSRLRADVEPLPPAHPARRRRALRWTAASRLLFAAVTSM